VGRYDPLTVTTHANIEPERRIGDDVGSPPGDREFRPDVQGLRAVAVLLVIAYHFNVPGISGGYVGVDVFFVISGFVITGLLLRERSARRATSLVGFYARRARRILPAASLVIVVTVLASYHWLGFVRGGAVAIDGKWASVFLSNLHSIQVGNSYFGAQEAVSPLLHFWSLSVEEQFYLVFPILFALLAARTTALRFRSVIVGVLLVTIIASLATSILQTASSPVTAYFSPFTRAWELALGALVAVSAPLLRRLTPAVATALSWIGLAMIAGAALGFTSTTPYPGVAVVLPVVGAGIVIAAGLVAPRFGAEIILGLRASRVIGDLSFSLYLWHFPVYVIARQVNYAPLRLGQRAVLIVLTFVLAFATYYLIENPIRHSSALRRRQATSIAMGLALIALCLGVCSFMIGIHGSSTRPVAGPASVGLVHLGVELRQATALNDLPEVLLPPMPGTPDLHPTSMPDRCFIGNGFASGYRATTLPRCTFGDTNATKTMVLAGDSTATMWSAALDRFARRHHYRLVILTKYACPPWVSSDVTLLEGPSSRCAGFHAFMVHRIREMRPAVTIFAGMVNNPKIVRTPSGVIGFPATLRELDGAAGTSILLGAIPRLSSGPRAEATTAECLARHQSTIQSCGIARSRAIRNLGPGVAGLEQVAVANGVAVVGVMDLFCTPTTCPPVVAHRVVYQNAFHMNVAYSTYLGDALGQVLVPVINAGTR